MSRPANGLENNWRIKLRYIKSICVFIHTINEAKHFSALFGVKNHLDNKSATLFWIPLTHDITIEIFKIVATSHPFEAQLAMNGSLTLQ